MTYGGGASRHPTNPRKPRNPRLDSRSCFLDRIYRIFGIYLCVLGVLCGKSESASLGRSFDSSLRDKLRTPALPRRNGIDGVLGGFIREVDDGEVAMIFLCGGVIRPCGGELVLERAQVDSFAIDADAGAPALHVVGPIDALEFRAGGRPEFSSVPDVLRVRGGAQVGLAIVEAVMVDVVGEHAGRHVDDHVVHLEVFAFFFLAVGERMHGVPGVRALVGVPFDRSQPLVVLGIDDGELALRQRDSPEGVAIAQPAIDEQQADQGLGKPIRDVQNNLDNPLLRRELVSEWAKREV